MHIWLIRSLVIGLILAVIKCNRRIIPQILAKLELIRLGIQVINNLMVMRIFIISLQFFLRFY